MQRVASHLTVRLAETQQERAAAHRLRYDVFVRELGGDGVLVDHAAGTEQDHFDPHFDHMILVDERKASEKAGHVVGVYRLMTDAGAQAAGQFYSEDEYDLGVLRSSGRRLLELGRSCLHPDYRGGPALFLIWDAIARYVAERDIDILFGVASFHGTDPAPIAGALSLLHHRHLAPAELRVRARANSFQPMDLLPEGAIDRPAALRATPALIKSYLRLGGVVGEGAFVDHSFNTIDICLVMDTARLSAAAAARYGQPAA